jgi:predicted membrane channel-forming protein YqfA (hemolysin III family)
MERKSRSDFPTLGRVKWGRAVRTRIACIVLVVAGILVNGLFLHLSFDPQERFARVATYALLGYMLAVPMAFLFLKGEHTGRLAVLAIWLIYVSLFCYVGLTLN